MTLRVIPILIAAIYRSLRERALAKGSPSCGIGAVIYPGQHERRLFEVILALPLLAVAPTTQRVTLEVVCSAADEMP